ncbi:MATE family efflux transporter [Thalassotalea sp. 1_MG-2023]|uniref:MATE family efflux transporter n=1 Tax=Thalassotalea sp. 1_MG-2023 TaxID=3062680 RepID=UPI0026E1B27F|nr:MATE family efflux transporter [Thalassotalea sp. 1_MG-2023]MDO6428358.1 MATE family efflux transporter [Thalassotalea sp. 1_MG-2023]
MTTEHNNLTTPPAIKRKVSIFALFKQALKGGHQDLTSGSIGVAAFILAVPMVLEMLMESIFAITDIFFVSGLGAEAVAVVGLTEAVLTLLYAVAIGLSMAVTATIARRYGEKNVQQANAVAGQTLWIGLAVALIVGFIGLNFAEDILILMGGNDAIVAAGKSYTTIMLTGSITILYLFLMNAIFRGAGDASVAMRSLWLANGINIVLDPMLIYGIGPFPEMGLTGAAVATTIGRGVGVLYQLNHLFGIAGRIQINIKHLIVKLSLIKQLLSLSFFGVIQFLIATASWIALVRIVSTYGSEATAGYTIAIRIFMFAILPAWGLSNAVATLVGQNLGADKPDRAESSVKRIAKYNIYYMVGVAVVFLVIPKQIIGLFSQDPLVIQYGVDCLRLISLGNGFFALGMILVQAFNGAGDTKTPTKVNLLCYWLIQIPLAYSLAKLLAFGPNGVFLSVTIAQAVFAYVGWKLFNKGLWKLKVV